MGKENGTQQNLPSEVFWAQCSEKGEVLRVHHHRSHQRRLLLLAVSPQRQTYANLHSQSSLEQCSLYFFIRKNKQMHKQMNNFA